MAGNTQADDTLRLLWQGAVRIAWSHLGRIPNCLEVPDTPLLPREQAPPPPLAARPGTLPKTPPPNPPPL